MFNWFRKSSAKAVPNYPDPETWEHANTRQKGRARRSFDEMKKRHVPVFPGPLFVDDDEEVSIQSAQDVARRVLVLWAVDMKAEGLEQEKAVHHLDELKLWDALSPSEREFLDDPNPDPRYSQKLIWRLESIWVLLWSLGHVENLEWPSGMCNTKVMVPLLEKNELNPSFIDSAKLRPTPEILDQQDLILRIHWAIRDAHHIKGDLIPIALDWVNPEEWVPADACAVSGVVEQRHYALNWLTSFMDADWDDIDTPT